MNRVAKQILESINRLKDHPSFLEWLSTEKVGSGDLVITNNSFVFRDVDTVKSDKYLALTIGENASLIPKPEIAVGLRINSDFKRFASKASNLPVRSNLDAAIAEEMAHLGHMLFILIAHVDDRTVLTEPLEHQAFESVSCNPTLGELIQIKGNRITVRETHDEETLWQAVTQHYQTNGQEVPQGLREAFGVALDKLQDKAVAELRIPAAGSSLKPGITDAIIQVLQQQRGEYANALARFDAGGAANPTALNEILRIAYNFASDATGYLNLIVSICDLKPIVLWGTIGEHYALSEAFRRLPWTRSRSKPSLKNYDLTISDARNSAFHNLFPFRKTLNVTLPTAALRGAELRLFSEHTKKKENQLSYHDKPLVDVLVEFTRARERQVSPRFWRQNLVVMESAIALFSKTNEYIKTLHASATAGK